MAAIDHADHGRLGPVRARERPIRRTGRASRGRACRGRTRRCSVPRSVGAGARISARAVVAHTTVGPDSIVPAGQIVRDRVWFGERRPTAGRAAESRPRCPTANGSRDSRSIRRHTRNRRVRSFRLSSTFDRRAKRVLDVAAALVSLTILAPLLALIAIAVWLESKGPIFFGDKREGEGGRVFRCWKFRTMFTGADRAQRQLNGARQYRRSAFQGRPRSARHESRPCAARAERRRAAAAVQRADG